MQPKNKQASMDLYPEEIDLILKIRNQYQWGEIIIECQNGKPWRIAQKVVYDKLDTNLK